ncbi:AraC family transcriptional regulator, partial [Parabacteroides sp.]
RQLGYPNVRYFSLIFKKITGIAPSEYPYAQN